MMRWRSQPGITGSQAALAYVLGQAGVSAAVVGATRLGHLEEDAGASGMALEPGLRDLISAAQARS